ncbi:hypothetical protein OS493_022447 [Desmophyllum pertusum]|uniref:Uncharacterized protein n=1 Tax=Desmophyllum pertusum TaxID=174260 RepID=A0A9W9ZMN3_9CNID|nr:hypothetical protein OS493_022447 [Desmophyllum pertusum]
MDGHKLVRPVLRQGSCRWLAKDKDLCIGEKHRFEIINPQPEGMYPQRTNDVLVNYINPCDQAEDNSDVGELYDILRDQSHQTVKEVFVDDKLPDVADDDDVLVMLGLTRPSSSLKHYQYRNKCGIIVVGFVAKCKYAQQHFLVECQHDYDFSSPEKPEDGGNTHEIAKAILPPSITMGRKRKRETKLHHQRLLDK